MMNVCIKVAERTEVRSESEALRKKVSAFVGVPVAPKHMLKRKYQI